MLGIGGSALAEGPLDWVLDKVPAGRDEWSIESIHDETAARLKDLAQRLAGAASITAIDGGVLEDFLAPELVCAGLQPAKLERVISTPSLEVERGEAEPGAGARPCTASGLASEIRACLPAVRRIEKAKFKTFRIEPRGDPVSLAATRALLELDGPGEPAGFLQVRAVWDIDWIRHGGGWRIRSIRPVSFERARLASRTFVDATEEALGQNASYRAQLVPGLEAWRTRLDSATGIDIYGHQGVAVGDYDGDGWEDLYVSQPAGLPNRLYRNLEGGTFLDVTDAAGVGVLDSTGGSLFVDLDNDGDLDLVVVTSLEVLIFENGGKGKLTLRPGTGLETASAKSATSMGAAAADYDLDGDIDLYVFCYIFWAGAGSRTHSSYPYPYHDAENGAPNFLFRNEGGLKFTDVTSSSGMDENNRRFSLAASWCDYDDDGWPDLCVANDFGRKNLYRNLGGGKFHDVAAQAGVEDVGNGMSVTWEDYDGDQRMDLYLGNMWSSAGSRIAGQPGFGNAGSALAGVYQRMARGNSLFRNLGGGRFEDVSLASNAYFGRWSWSCQFIDHDGDGREDLYIANGFVTNEETDDL